MDGFDLLGVQVEGEESKISPPKAFLLGLAAGALLLYVISQTVEASHKALQNIPKPARYLPGPEERKLAMREEFDPWENTQEDSYRPWAA